MHYGVILINLGSPDSADVEDIRTFLHHMLSEPGFLPDRAWLKQWILHMVLSRRPQKIAPHYRSTLIDDRQAIAYHGVRLAEKLRRSLDAKQFDVLFAMRFSGRFSLENAVECLKDCDRILFVPLFPQFSRYTTECCVKNLCAEHYAFFLPYGNHPDFISLYVDYLKRFLDNDVSTLILSYHSVPFKNGLRYRDDCLAFSEAVRRKLPNLRILTAFQSKFGPARWLEPKLNDVVKANRHCKKICVATPGFAADCIETLHELSVDARRKASKFGVELVVIPCLNDDDGWTDFLTRSIREIFRDDP